MRVGYACVNTQLPSSSRTLRLANVTPARLRELIAANLDALEAILRWNADHGIGVFRLTSNLIPFGSRPANTLPWREEFAERFAELDYHARLLGAFGLDESHKIVLHVGSGAAAPEEAAARFSSGYRRLGSDAQARLVVENDERWTLACVLELAAPLALPVVFDVFHHSLAPSLDGVSARGGVVRASATWRPRDGRQEVHFSTQEPGKRRGAHSEALDEEAFRAFAAEVGDLQLDCILEVKDKERSALRAQELLAAGGVPSAAKGIVTV
jgi:UV DNA damage endonuclease